VQKGIIHLLVWRQGTTILSQLITNHINFTLLFLTSCLVCIPNFFTDSQFLKFLINSSFCFILVQTTIFFSHFNLNPQMLTITVRQTAQFNRTGCNTLISQLKQPVSATPWPLEQISTFYHWYWPLSTASPRSVCPHPQITQNVNRMKTWFTHGSIYINESHAHTISTEKNKDFSEVGLS
jgi:hypothetical protein